MLYYRGTLDAKRASTYQGKTRVQLQFIERRDDGAISLMEIKVPDDMDHSAYQEGKNVDVPVDVSVVDNQAYFRVSKSALHAKK